MDSLALQHRCASKAHTVRGFVSILGSKGVVPVCHRGDFDGGKALPCDIPIVAVIAVAGMPDQDGPVFTGRRADQAGGGGLQEDSSGDAHTCSEMAAERGARKRPTITRESPQPTPAGPTHELTLPFGVPHALIVRSQQFTLADEKGVDLGPYAILRPCRLRSEETYRQDSQEGYQICQDSRGQAASVPVLRS
jgi:hypothetical protein